MKKQMSDDFTQCDCCEQHNVPDNGNTLCSTCEPKVLKLIKKGLNYDTAVALVQQTDIWPSQSKPVAQKKKKNALLDYDLKTGHILFEGQSYNRQSQTDCLKMIDAVNLRLTEIL